MNPNVKFILLGTAIGIAVGAASSYLLTGDDPSAQIAEQTPLYWVAPMDASYRRDGPGLSPMGMELVPVYDSNANGASPGLVSISPTMENNLGVRTELVEVGPFRSNIRTVGYVRFDEDRMVHMHPRIEGWIDVLNVKTQGEFIESGQPIYSIYSPELVNAQEELLIALSRENQRQNLVESSEERLLALQVPQQLIDRVKAEKRVFQTVTVYAPQDGLVAELAVREGQFVQPGNRILSIGVLDEVWVIAEVFERQGSLVSIGDPVTMSLDYLPGRTWQGVVDFIYPTLDEDTRTIPVRLRFENKDQVLKPNMFAQVTIQHSEEGQQALLIPSESVIRNGVQDRVVLALGEGKFKSVEVNLGRRGDTKTEILSGLQAGDTVVTSAHFLLDSESSITSDFARMSADNMEADHTGHNMAEPAVPAVDHSNHVMGTTTSATTEQTTETTAAMDHSDHDMSEPVSSEVDHSNHDMPTAEQSPTVNYLNH
jgi:membrane fusion protein, copper/silver efflux system